eukprot:scaffold106_cov380-Prasinococcus_capsulatus_cf.AAC.11
MPVAADLFEPDALHNDAASHLPLLGDAALQSVVVLVLEVVRQRLRVADRRERFKRLLDLQSGAAQRGVG